MTEMDKILESDEGVARKPMGMKAKCLLTPQIIGREIARMRGTTMAMAPVVELRHSRATDAIELVVDGECRVLIDERCLEETLDDFSDRVLYPVFGHVLTNPSWTYYGP